LNKKIAVALLPALAAGYAQAQVFKCVDSGGKTSYSQAPCPAAHRNVEVNIRATVPPTPAQAPLSVIQSTAAAAPGPDRAAGGSSGAKTARLCTPLPPSVYVSRKKDLETALSSASNSSERREALRLELRYLEEEERWDQMPVNLIPLRQDQATRVTSIVGETRMDALNQLRKIFALGWDWDNVPDKHTGAGTWLCRSIQTGAYGPEANCECKPRTDSRWKN
jgi:hypothetical protein